MGTAAGARNIGKLGGIAVGGYIAAEGIWAAPLTGASMNPARSLGPDIVRGDFSASLFYVLGPFVGAVIGAAFEWALKGRPMPVSVACRLRAAGILTTKDERKR
jgi:aquaporin Z